MTSASFLFRPRATEPSTRASRKSEKKAGVLPQRAVQALNWEGGMRVVVPIVVKMWVVRERAEGGVVGGQVRTVVEAWMEEAVLGMARMMVVEILVVPLAGRAVPLGLEWLLWCNASSIWGIVTPARMLMRSFPLRALVRAGGERQVSKSWGWQPRMMVPAD